MKEYLQEGLKMPNIVPGDGPKDAKICIIGEAPGEMEDHIGKPFVGKSGQELELLMNAAGILRSECYFTNVVKERPPNNDITHFIDLSKKEPILTDAYLQYEESLYKELAELKANVFVPLGNVSLYALTRMTGITKRRGSILELRTSSGYFIEKERGLIGRKVIPIIHPASTLRPGGYLYRYYITYDFRKVRAEAEFPEVRVPVRDYILEPSFRGAEWFLRHAYTTCKRGRKKIAFDIEGPSGSVDCISFSLDKAGAISIPFVKLNGHDYFTIEEETELWLLIAKILEEPRITKVAHNCIYDAYEIYKQFGIVTSPLEDTQTAHRMLFPDFPATLDFLTSMITNEPYYKDEGKQGIQQKGGDDLQFWKYNAKDSAVTLEINETLTRILEEQGNTETYERQMRTISPLMYMMHKGFAVDKEGMRRESDLIGERITALEGELNKIVGGEGLNARSHDQVKTYFYGLKKLPPYRLAGKVTVNVDAMIRIKKKGYKEAQIILDIRELTTLRSTFLNVKFPSGGRMRGSFSPMVKTGRFSSSHFIDGTGANMQNQPKEVKRFFLADPGHILITIDLSNAENRIVANVGPVPTMLSAFEKGIDLHSQTYAMMFNIDVSEVSREKGSSSFGDGKKSQRGLGKLCNHSLNYGLSYKGFSQKVEIPEREAKDLVERFHFVHPAVRGNYHKYVKGQLERSKVVVNCYGRKRRFMDRFGSALLLDAYAQIPQSTVADHMNEHSFLFLYANEDFPDVEVLLQEHDSLTLQMPLAAGPTRIAFVIKAICTELEKPIPWKDPFSIPAEAKVGFSLGECRELDLKGDVEAQLKERIDEDRSGSG